MAESHEFDWLTPSSFWSSNGYREEAFFRPTLFRFDSDEFMEEFLAAVAAPTNTALDTAMLKPLKGGIPNKLFQPIHGSFYLAAASLCCRETGFPDRQIARGDGERTGFVLRKLVNGLEFGWVPTGEEPGWKELDTTARTLREDEEQLPTFAVPLANGRKLFCGYIPTSSSETFGDKNAELVVGSSTVDLRVRTLKSRVTDKLMRHDALPSVIDAITDDDAAYTTSVYLMVELWDYFTEELKEIANAVENDTGSPQITGDQATEKQVLFSFLGTQTYKGALSLEDVLKKVAANYAALNVPGGGDLDDLGFTLAAHSLKNSHDLDNAALQTLLDRVENALPDEQPLLEVPKLATSSAVRYVLRFVYERPQCEPAIAEVSRPSQPFTFAPFFDPDAPARTVRIPLPSDVSIAGMRKFKKNVSFMMSDSMRKKMGSLVGNEQSILDGSGPGIEDDSGGFAFICSFSIQIIFIVAFMLLLIFVVVFNLVFWWLAFFRICLPVPKDLLPE